MSIHSKESTNHNSALNEMEKYNKKLISESSNLNIYRGTRKNNQKIEYDIFQFFCFDPFEVDKIFKRVQKFSSLSKSVEQIESIYDYFKQDSSIIIVYLKNQNSLEFQNEKKKLKLNLKKILQICDDISFALKHFHQNNFCHGNLNLKNILFSDSTTTTTTKIIGFYLPFHLEKNTIFGSLNNEENKPCKKKKKKNFVFFLKIFFFQKVNLLMFFHLEI